MIPYRHINHFIKNKRNFLIAVVSISLLLAGSVYYYRADASSFIWYELRLFPRVALFFNNEDARLAKNIGNYYFNRRSEGAYDLEKAEIYFYRALEINPEIPRVWHQLARIDFLQGNLGSALGKINKQIEIHGDSQSNSYYVRGLIYSYSGQFEKAEADFLRFLEWKEKSWAANNDLAWIYFRQGRYEKTEEIAQRGLLYDHDNPWLLNMRGVSLLNLNRKEEAESILLQALAEAQKLTEEDWRNAYTGNDPRIAKQGLNEMVTTIESNLELVVD